MNEELEELFASAKAISELITANDQDRKRLEADMDKLRPKINAALENAGYRILVTRYFTKWRESMLTGR